MLRLGARPVPSRSSGTYATPAAIAARGSPGRSARPDDVDAPRRRRPHPGDRLGELALPVAGDARDRDDLAGARASSETSLSGRRAAVAVGPDVVELEHRLRRGRAAARRGRAPRSSRPTISAASERGVASAVSTVAIERPPRSTVTRSATAFTSCSLCEMKITVRPSSAISRSVSNSTSASCGVSTAVGSSRIRTRASR